MLPSIDHDNMIFFYGGTKIEPSGYTGTRVRSSYEHSICRFDNNIMMYVASTNCMGPMCDCETVLGYLVVYMALNLAS